MKVFNFVFLILVHIILTKCQDFRLPNSLVPVHYSLELRPILDDTPGHTRFTAPGKVQITVRCDEDTDTVKLHALDITILENLTRVSSVDNGDSIAILEQSQEPENHFVIIKLRETLRAGRKYDVLLEFITSVSETRLDGMYLDQYVDPATNQTKYVATTLFAAISARRCFPCFDEPQFKAVFSISLGRKEGYHSLSNMHQTSTEAMPGQEGWYLDRFAPSLNMSTYLVAMIVSDMTYEQANTISNDISENNATIRVYAPYYFINRGGGTYAANQTKTVLAKYEDYFDSNFMLQKLDSVSLPRFFFSAMENWALITYNDRVLLYFAGESTEQERYRITSIIAHEVGHHYFGNLVTCEWWTWIWLNEGGATYISYLGVEKTYPEFNPWERFITDVHQAALEFDASDATHPVANEPQTLQAIGGIYDDIAYEKGASLLRMMRGFLSENVMQTGLRRWIREKQFQNARQDELFLIMNETAQESNVALPRSLKEIMDTWTLQSGFPLIRVQRVSADEVEFTQEKFQQNPTKAEGNLWWVPVSVSVVSPTPKEYFFWMSNASNTTQIPIPESEIFIVNSRSEGYFRTLYSSELLDTVLEQSERKCGHSVCLLDSSAKATILDDYITFEKQNLSSQIPRIEKLVNSLCLQEENLVVWETLLKHYTRELLKAFRSHDFNHTDDIKDFMKKTLLSKMNDALKRLEKMANGSTGENMMLRSELLFWTCLLKKEQSICANFAEAKMKAWEMSNGITSAFQPDLEDTYHCAVVAENDKYFHLIQDFAQTQEKMPCAQVRMLSSLACTENEDLFKTIYPKLREEMKELVEVNDLRKFRINAENLPVIRMALRISFNENVRRIVYE